MKKLALGSAICFGWLAFAWGAAPPPALTNLKAVLALSNAQASQSLPVVLEATVTYAPGREGILFVQDGDLAIFVLDNANTKLAPGDRILVRGTTQSSFRIIVVAQSVILLRHGVLPAPVPATFDGLLHNGQYDSRLVIMRGVIRTADLKIYRNVRYLYLQMIVDGGYVDVAVDSDNESAFRSLLDAQVEVTGVAGGIFDGKMQQTGVLLHATSLENVKVLKRASVTPDALPVTPMGQIISGYHVLDQSQRVRVHGTITYYLPGLAVVLQDGSRSLWIKTLERMPMQIGDVADATGFPDVNDGALVLTHGEIVDTHVLAPIAPLPATWHQLALWSANRSEGHLYDLVSIEGQVVTEVREATQDEYVLSADGQMFSAVFRHQNGGASAMTPPMKAVSVGSRIRVTGICIINDTNPFYTTKEASFNILLRSFDDVVIVARPSLLSIHNLIIVLSVMLLVVMAVSIWGLTLRLKVRSQTGALAAMAEFEQHRSRVLENINGSKPLAEILEEISGMVSLMLHGAPCWCEVTDGARLGNYPPNADHLRVRHQKFFSHSGPPLGTFFAAFDPAAPPFAVECETLSAGARLAALAIETRRLYSDLLRRSEFDLLTDIYNRFSLQKHLDALIEEARASAGIFGMIYVDLDEFKQVNDQHGHHVGDLYLREVAQRMKQQLRARDLMARLGGDEFVVLLPTVRNRASVDEVLRRLEHCFDEPFVLEGHTLQGAASFGIALYPEDGTTADGLLNAADAAMYAVKNGKRQACKASTRHSYPGPPSDESLG
jgi:diguanylate cyclase (GGDEF)-like protein